MKMRTLVIAVAFGLVGLIVAAFVVDCHRLALAARSRVDLADQELRKHERRLVKTLAAAEERSPYMRAALTAYEAAADQPARHDAYEQLVAVVRESAGAAQVDPTDPLNRKFKDDIAGAINRRERAEPAYDAELAAYHDYMRGFRGAVVTWFSPAE
jgi:hypothetical protein